MLFFISETRVVAVVRRRGDAFRVEKLPRPGHLLPVFVALVVEVGASDLTSKTRRKDQHRSCHLGLMFREFLDDEKRWTLELR